MRDSQNQGMTQAISYMRSCRSYGSKIEGTTSAKWRESTYKERSYLRWSTYEWNNNQDDDKMILIFYFWKKIKQSREMIDQEKKEKRKKEEQRKQSHLQEWWEREREGPNKTKIKRKGKTSEEDQRNSIDVNDSVTVWHL